MNYPILKPREKSRWLNLSQGSLPLALARYLPHKRLKVVLTQDAEQALRLQTAWRFFRPHDTAVFLPDWETLPYERFSPHQDLVSERLSALWQIKSGAADVLFVPVATAMQKLPPVPFLAGRTFWLKNGQTLDIGRLKTDLVDAGYNHVSHVVAAGEFAVRGGIVDLFPMGSEMPYRIDLFDDEIDSIKTFDTDTQRTISPPTARRKKSSAAASARKSMAIRTMPPCTKPSATAISARAWNIICRCFLKTSWKRCLTISAKMRCLSLWATFTPRQTAFGATSNHVMPWRRATKPIRLCFHSICISLPMCSQVV